MAQVVAVLDAVQIAAIRVAREKQVGAIRASDWGTFERAYDEAAVVMPPNTSPIETRAKIRAFVENYPKIDRFDLTEIEIDGRADFAYERGRYDLIAGGISDYGSHFTLWRQQNDGSWKIYRDMWHSDKVA